VELLEKSYQFQVMLHAPEDVRKKYFDRITKKLLRDLDEASDDDVYNQLAKSIFIGALHPQIFYAL
jgi:hypothetical protein